MRVNNKVIHMSNNTWMQFPHNMQNKNKQREIHDN